MNIPQHYESEIDPLAFLAGGGEMGERTRAFDWSGTPLGAVERWSPALRMMVRLMLANRLPMLLWWGPEYTCLYNDPYRPVLGNKHPWALGQPVSECWKEIWDVLKPLIDTPFYGGPATWDEDILLELNRHGYIEETHFTIAYSPVPDESVTSGIGGVLATIHEITEKVVGERRMIALRDLGTRSAEAKTAEAACVVAAATLEAHPKDVPFALFYLTDSEGTHAHLTATTGTIGSEDVAPSVILMDRNDGKSWPLAAAKQSMQPQVATDLDSHFLALPPGPWSDPPNTAVVLPIGSGKRHEPVGFLIVGVSSRLQLDDAYQGFLDLAVTQVATAIASARAYEEEKRRAEALAELDRAKTTFFSNVSHEFRTPLTLILGPLDDVISETTDRQQRDRLLTLKRNALRLQKLVNALLDFSRLEAGRVQARYQPTDLATLTSDLASNFRSACEKAGLEFRVYCPPLPEPVYVDREMWEKIVLNLLSNAFKFTLRGGIQVTLSSSGQQAELRVQDTGVGIPDDQLPKVFERFHRVEGITGRSQEGSGIGLALVRELARLHGGEVSVESEVGRGTSFVVTIPFGLGHLPEKRLAAPAAADSSAVRATHYVEEVLRWLPDTEATASSEIIMDAPFELVTPTERTSAEKPRILVADDNADMRQYLRSLLAVQYDVEAVADGQSALESAKRSPPELILTDVMMPALDGFELLRQLRSDPQTASIPVIMLSARAGEESRSEGMEAGADDYLVKPFGARELLARVTAHLQIAQLRQQANQSLKAQREELREAQRVAHIGSWRWDSKTDASTGSDELYRIYGLDPETQTLPDFKDQDTQFYPHDEWLRLNDAVQESLRTGIGYELDVKAIRNDGPIWITARSEVVKNEGGEVVGLRGTVQDITARKRVEEALRQSEERMRLLWEAAAVLLTTDDPDTMLRKLFAKIGPHLNLDTYFNFMVNDGGDGLKLASCIGITDETARTIENLAFGQAICGTVAVLRKPLTATSIQESDDPKVQLVKSFGIRAYACNPLMAGDELLGTLSFASRSRDHFDADELDFLQTICQYVTAAYERLRLIGRLRESDRRKDEFLATLAHELRNPLAPIRNGLQVLRLGGVSGEMADDAGRMMERQLAQMVRLIDDLLDLSRISRGKIELRKERVELAKVVQHAVETSRPLIDQACHELLIDVPTASIFVDADVTRLAQVFSNLLNNATKYTERGGRLNLSVQRRGNEVAVSVRDNGMGIPAHMLPKVFDMFTQVDRNLERAQGGLGIGLSIVKRLVEMHDGSVEVKSDGHGMGSEFIVQLPIVLSVAQPNYVDEQDGEPSTRRRILVVDDNRDAAMSLAMMLKLMGNDAKTAHDGFEALEAAAAYRPDLILLDIGMPRLNGYETAKAIREKPWGKTIVLVALTGWGQEDDRRRSEAAGFDSHMVKPIEPAILEKLLVTSNVNTA